MSALLTPILVLGAPRSGTSLTAGLLHQFGAWVGKCRPSDKWNERGYFENNAIRTLCWKMRKSKSRTALSAQVLSVDDVRAVLKSQGWRGQKWLYKHAPHAVDHFENFNPIRVKVWRDPEAILRSRVAKGHDPKVVEESIAQHTALLKQMDGIDFHPEALIAGDHSELRRVAKYCGLAYDRDKAEEFMDPALWHH